MNFLSRSLVCMVVKIIFALSMVFPLLSRAQNPVSIYDIQYTTDPSGNSPLLGQSVTISGTVSGLFVDGYMISDSTGPWNSIFVYSITEAPLLFEKVELTGTVNEYYGMTEINTVTNYIVLSNSGTIEATLVNANEANAEQFESVLIMINNPVVTSLENYGEWIIRDSSGTLRCDDLNDYMYFPQVGDSLISIKGILFYSYGDFKLEPRFTNDISANHIPHYALKGDVVTMNENFDILQDAYLEILGDQVIGIHNTPPAGITVTDVQGFIFPGFIDAHNHAGWNIMDFIPFDQIFYHRNEWRSTQLYQEVKNQHNGIIDYGGNDAQYANVVKIAEIRALCAGTTMMQGINCNGHDYDPAAREGMGINNAERFPSRIFSSIFPLWQSASYWQERSDEYWDRFVIHLAEGTNQTALNEFTEWKNLNILDERTTIIHGTALTQQEFTEMAAVNTHLIWSPKSNWVLYENTADIPAALAAGVNVALAPD